MILIAAILLSLVQGLEERATAPFSLNSTFNANSTISALSMNNDTIIASLTKLDYSYQDIITGAKYTLESGKTFTSQLNFVSSREAYASDGSANLVKLRFADSKVAVTDVIRAPGEFLSDISVGKKGTYVSTLTQQMPNNSTSALWKFTNGNFSKVHDFDGILHRIALSPNETKLFGIVKTNTRERSIVALTLSTKKSLPHTVVTTRDDFKSGISAIKCDRKGNIYLANFDENVNVYGPDYKFKYNISTTVTLRAMAISNTTPQYLYLGGQVQDSEPKVSGVERLEL